jgi:hypothetical protein
MTDRSKIRVARLSTGRFVDFDNEADALRFIMLRGDESQLWEVIASDWRPQ